MNHYLKYISNIIWPEAYEQYISCRDKALPKSITLVDYQIKSEYIYDLLTKTDLELNKPNIYIPNHYLAAHDYTKWWLGKNIYHQLGLFYIQESSAALPASLLDLKTGDLVLDMCASPGGKSVQILNELNKLLWWILVSNEIDRSRIETLKENIYKYWFTNDIIISHDAKYIWQTLPETFDKILVDAPCSGEGTCHRDTKFLNHWSLDLVNKTAKLQLEIINNIYNSLKPWWTLIYSTCTINPIENEWVVAKFLAEHDDMRLVDLSDLWFASGFGGYELDDENCKKVVRLLPHINHTGGFFVAKFIKAKNAEIAKKAEDIKIVENAEIQNFRKYIYDKFEIKLDRWYFYQKDEYIYYCDFVDNDLAKSLVDKVFKSVAGIPVAKISRKWYILDHAFAKVFGKFASKWIVYIDNLDNLTKLFAEWIIDVSDDLEVIWDNKIDNQYIFVQSILDAKMLKSEKAKDSKSDNISDINIYIWIAKVLPNWLKFNM